MPKEDSLDDFFGVPVNVVGTVDPTFGDGVYLMLAPLPAGSPEMAIYPFDDGDPSTVNDEFRVDVTYNLVIE